MKTFSLFVCVLIHSILFCDSGASAEEQRPNILWITCEDMSAHLGCYGDDTVPTPNMDQLAKEGVRYTRAFGVYGVCAPNRHSIILGMYPTSTGAMAMRNWRRTSALKMITDPKLLAIPTYEAVPPPEAKCFTEYLRAAGYYCTNNVKTDYQFNPPVTAWDESSGKAHWRNRPNQEQPFFSVFNFTVTHESGTFKKRSPEVVDPSKVKLPPYYPDTPLVRRDLARHYDNIAALDKQITKVLNQLKQDGLDKNTIVFFFSDHGDGLPRAKRWVYDSGLHVPLIIRYPDGMGAGTTNDELVSFVDLAPTMLSLIGVQIPSYMQGQAFLGPQKSEPRKYIYAARDRMDPAPETIRAVRDKRFKYVRNYRTDLPYFGYIPYRDQAAIMQEIHRLTKAGELGPDQWQLTGQTKPKEELYDTQTDPHEIHNLAEDPQHAEKLKELRAAHEAWTKQTGDLGHMDEGELVKKVLWPPNGKQPTTAEPKIVIQPFLNAWTLFITCATEGASIGYRVGEKGTWQLYTEPVLMEGDPPIEAIAHRIGWKPSKQVSQGKK